MELERLFKCHCSHEPDDDIDSDIETVPTVINEGFMLKKGAICQNWKKRYFELFDDGKLVYYTDENKQIRRGIADISNVIRFNVVDNKTFEVTTPQRIWCFQCKFKSECEYWIESMKAVQHSQLHQDGASPKVWDHLNLSANESVHKFIAKMGSPDEERILYSDRIIVNNQDGDDQHQKSTVLMLTTAAIYHLRPNQNNNFKKCDRRIPWRDVGCCDVVNPQEMCIENMLYLTETENLKSILRTLCSVDVKVMFQREEDQMMLQTNPISEEDDDEDLVDSLPMKSRYVHTMTSSVQSGSEMKEIYDTDHEVEDEQHHKHHALPSYIESGSENKEPEEMECPAMRSLRVTDFTIISVIGRGTFGKILMVKKKSDGAVFAMKILKKTQIIQDAQTLNIKAERKVLKRYSALHLFVCFNCGSMYSNALYIMSDVIHHFVLLVGSIVSISCELPQHRSSIFDEVTLRLPVGEQTLFRAGLLSRWRSEPSFTTKRELQRGTDQVYCGTDCIGHWLSSFAWHCVSRFETGEYIAGRCRELLSVRLWTLQKVIRSDWTSVTH